MQETDIETTLVMAQNYLDSSPSLSTTLLSEKRRNALLNTMEIQKQEHLSKDVVTLMEHRERQATTTTIALGMLVAPDQEAELTKTFTGQSKSALPSILQQEPAVAEVVQAEQQQEEAPVEQDHPVAEQSAPEPPKQTPAAPAARAKFSLPKFSLKKRQRVPVLQQMSMVECGAACIAMILSYYGRKTSVSEVRDRCGVGRDGLSALSVVKAARSYGLRVRAVSLQDNDLRFVRLPAIVHWEFNHFLIVEKWTPKYVDLVDPAVGRRRVTAEEFDNGFTGVVLMPEPGVQFDRTSHSSKVNLLSYVKNYVALAPASLLQVLGASFVLQLFGLALPILTALVVDQIIPLGMNDALILLAIGLCLLFLAQLVTTLLRASVLLYLQTRVDTQMMVNFFEQLLFLPQQFFQQRSSGDILTRLASNTVIRDTISNQLVSTVLDGSFVLVYFIILLVLSPLVAVLALVIGVIQLILLLTTNRLVHDLAARELIAQGRSQAYASEALVGIATLKASGAEERALLKWSNLFFDQMNASVKRSFVASLIDTMMTTLRTFSPLLLLIVGSFIVLQGSMSIGTMLGLLSLATAFLTPLSSLVGSAQKIQLVHSHLERIADVLEAEPEQNKEHVSDPPELTGNIRLDRVTFRYDPNSPPVLKDISVSLFPGQKVAIVGRTGSGKTTLGNLLLGLYLPTEGEILYDGLPLSSLDYQAVRSQFGVVMQGSSIFSGSVRQNIALSNPNMGMDKILKAAKAAAIHDDIMKMPMEYETMVSEGGSALSGGQRQRIALARALANSPVILLLDEATSALDVVTEQAVERNLQQLDCTQIVIAHRLSTIRNADLILVIDQGTILERGSHYELLEQDGFYAQLIQSQLAKGEIKAV